MLSNYLMPPDLTRYYCCRMIHRTVTMVALVRLEHRRFGRKLARCWSWRWSLRWTEWRGFEPIVAFSAALSASACCGCFVHIETNLANVQSVIVRNYECCFRCPRRSLFHRASSPRVLVYGCHYCLASWNRSRMAGWHHRESRSSLGNGYVGQMVHTEG